MNWFTFIIPIFFIFFLVLFIIFYKDIMSFISPQNFITAEIEEKDGNIILKTFKKNKDLSFKFRNGIYFMYYVEKSTNPLKPPLFDNKAKHTYKRLALFKYKEGNSYPIKDNVLVESDALYNQSLLEQRYTDLAFEKGVFDSDIFKYIMIGGVVLIVLVIVYGLFNQSPAT